MPPFEGAGAEMEKACGGACGCGARSGAAARVVGRSIIIVGIAGLIGVIDSARRPVQLALKPTVSATVRATGAGQNADVDAQPDREPGVSEPVVLDVRITLAQARALYDSGDAEFIDAREANEYGPGHIPGAYNLTQADFRGSRTPDVLTYLDPSRPVVIYCGGGECHASENVAILLQQAGFASIHIMVEGFPSWVEAGYEVEASHDESEEGGGS
ncbi:MAG: rhodanese-like domain-containing protein [Phycisphaeraceae bacterium]|nr:rhodanese-like domain-containing protein [Phycisphaeraceae bacterium]